MILWHQQEDKLYMHACCFYFYVEATRTRSLSLLFRLHPYLQHAATFCQTWRRPRVLLLLLLLLPSHMCLGLTATWERRERRSHSDRSRVAWRCMMRHLIVAVSAARTSHMKKKTFSSVFYPELIFAKQSRVLSAWKVLPIYLMFLHILLKNVLPISLHT